MSLRGDIIKATRGLAEEAAREQGVDLVDVEYIRQGKDWFLRIYIDKRGGVTLDDCEKVSRAIDPLIDEQVPIREAYHLEVSSPGLQRPLKTPADFERYMGEWVEASLYKAKDGKKKWEGILEAYRADGTVTMRLEDETTVDLTREETAKIRRAIRF